MESKRGQLQLRDSLTKTFEASTGEESVLNGSTEFRGNKVCR